MNKSSDDQQINAISTDDIGKYIKPDFIYIICGCYRYGVQTFVIRLDFELPDKLDDGGDDSLHMHVTNYAGLTWLVVGVNRHHLDFCRKLADQVGFNMMRGVPKASNQNDRFPIHHSADSLYTLEYKKTPATGDLTHLMKKERRWISQYLVRQEIDQEYEEPDETSSIVVNLKMMKD